MSFVAGWRSHPRELAQLECYACKGGRRWLHSASYPHELEYFACYKIYTFSNCLGCSEGCTLLFVLALFVE